MWGYIIGTLCKPINENNEKYAKQYVWEVRNLKIITWINNSIDNLLSIWLAKYEIAKKI